MKSLIDLYEKKGLKYLIQIKTCLKNYHDL